MFKYGNWTILEVIYGPVTVLQNELICGYLKLNIKCVLVHFISDIMIWFHISFHIHEIFEHDITDLKLFVVEYKVPLCGDETKP